MNVTQQQIERAWNGEHVEVGPRLHLCKYTEDHWECLRIFDGRTTVGEAVATRSAKVANPPKGRGFGRFVESEPVTRVDQVKVGDLLTYHSIQFNACNLIRVTQTDWPEQPASLKGAKFYAEIVDPKDPTQPGIGTNGEVCFWDWAISGSGTELHRAVLRRAPVVSA